MGRSLGGAVAINLAPKIQDQIRGIIVENTFTSISHLADIMIPFAKPIKRFVQRNFWSSIDTIKKINVPMLFIRSMLDEMIPPSHSQDLYDAAINSVYKDMVIFEYLIFLVQY